MSDASEVGFPVVGVGASAGGLEALREFVQAISRDSGMCYVVVQHLAPDHPSIMDQLLASHSQIPVVKIEHGAWLKPNVVYVIPAGPELTLKDGRFRLHQKPPERGLRTPIDRFFQSLSEQIGRRAYCVVLSGTGSDGTAGLRAIKAAGGVAIAQELRSARFSGMPENAAATGLVDFVLTPERIARRLQEIEAHRETVEAGENKRALHEQIGQRLSDIIDLIDDAEGHDFSSYKTGTLVRRVERRMTIMRQRTVEGLIETLKAEPDERTRMLQDFLIGVTQFFRDPDAFEHLDRQIIQPMVLADPQRIRVWVPGCSTGEEAYSIAILLSEALDRHRKHIPVQVFGTDIDLSALSRARAGEFAVSALEPISPERRERYFIKEGERATVAPRLREMCVFAPHNLIADPPFSRLDLISCRNVLIYLNSDVQTQIISRFHYALHEGGTLFLGPSETLGAADRYFDPIEKERRLFKRNDQQKIGYSSLSERHNRDTPLRAVKTLPAAALPVLSANVRGEQPFEQGIEQFVLRQYAPPHAVINRRNEIVYLSENMAPFIGPSRGVPSSALDVFLTRELRLPVRSALEKARETGREVVEENIIVPVGDGKQVFDVVVAPAPQDPTTMIATLRSVRVQNASELAVTTDARIDRDREILDRELALTRRQLAAAQAEHDAVDQELRSSNEELLSMNEELQSANEELETSREELQSINEELETINAELMENNRQLTRANSDLKNLFESTEIATLFLDANLCVRRFTPETTRLFGIKERDMGRPLEDLASHIPFETIKKDALVAINDLKPVSTEITVGDGRFHYMLRARPYRTIDDRLDGCVISFIDITERYRNEMALAESQERLSSALRAGKIGVHDYDPATEVAKWDDRARTIFGVGPDYEVTYRKFLDIVLPEDRQAVIDAVNSAFQPNGDRYYVADYRIRRVSDGEIRWVRADGDVTFDNGQPTRLVGTIIDITDAKLSDERIRQSEERLRASVATSLVGIGFGDRHGRIIDGNDAFFRLTGYSREEILDGGIGWKQLTAPEYADVDAKMIAELAKNGTAGPYQKEYIRKDGSRIPLLLNMSRREGTDPVEDEHVAFITDISEIKQAEAALRESEARKTLLMQELQHRVKNTLATTLAIIRFSGRHSTDVTALVTSLQARLSAIAKTHDLLTQKDWNGSHLSDLIESEMAPYASASGQRYAFEGHDPYLNAEHALSLSLALHELATNAAKYGALSNGEGRVRIWCAREDGNITITWCEEDGPQIEVPTSQHEGFGSFLIKRVLGQEVGGSARLELEPSGLRCVVTIPNIGRGVADT